MIGTDYLSAPPPSPVNDPQGASGVGPGGAASPGAVGTLLGTSGGPGGAGSPGMGGPGGMAGGAAPQQALAGVLQVGQGLTEQLRSLAQSLPIMAPKLMQAVTLIEQALADFMTSSAGNGAVPMGGQATPGAFSSGAAFPR
jgi:hypothetical protein